MKVLNSKVSRQVEQEAVEYGISLRTLMENAGNAVADFIKGNLVSDSSKKRIVILCGKGNNGGDGFVIANNISDIYENVYVILVDGEPKTDDARFMFEKISEYKGEKIFIYDYDIGEDMENIINGADIIVDAIYGIGFKGKVNSKISRVIECINNRAKAKVVSVDLPSGLQCDTGVTDSDFIKSDYTVTFTSLKSVHILYPSSNYCGEVVIKDVGIPKDIVNNCESMMNVIDMDLVKKSLPKFEKSSSKKDRGRLFSLCSSVGMPGASVMSAKAALRTGVGLLDVAVLRENYSVVAGQLLEPIFTLIDSDDGNTYSFNQKERIFDSISKANACLIGCGLGVSKDTERLVSEIIRTSKVPMVIDADGINIVSKNIDILKTAVSNIILTPHPGEMARLIDVKPEEVQKNRYEIAREFSVKNNVVLVLKGSNILVSLPNRMVYVNLTGNNGMAKGGSGDVLAGMIASFLAQGMDSEKASLCAVYLHGLAGDVCSQKHSKTSMLPTDIIDELNQIFIKIEH